MHIHMPYLSETALPSVVALYTYQGSEFGDMTFAKGDQVTSSDGEPSSDVE